MMNTPPAGQALAYPDLLKQLSGLEGFLARQLNLWVFGMEAILLTNIGARAARLNRLLGGLPFLLLMVVVAFWFEGPRGFEMLSVAIMVIVACLHRNVAAWRTLRSGAQPTHTWFMGESVLHHLSPMAPEFTAWLLQDAWVVYRFVHPFFLIGLALVIHAAHGSLIVAFYVGSSGAFMMGKNGLLHTALVDHYLEQYDSSLSRAKLPKLIEHIQSGTPGPYTDHAGMPVSPAIIDVLRRMPVPDVDTIVRDAMATNGATPAQAFEERPHE